MSVKLLVLGTSNSLLKAGWVAGLVAALPDGQIERRGVGGRPSAQFVTEAREDFTRFDAVILDTLPNDETFAEETGEGPRYSRIARDLCATIAAQTRLVFFGVSGRPFASASSPQRDAWREMVRRCGGQYVDVNALLSAFSVDYLDPGAQLYETDAHPRQEIAWSIGHSLGLALRTLPPPRCDAPNRADRCAVLDAKELVHSGQVIKRRNSLFDIDFVCLRPGQSLELPRLWPGLPYPLLGFYTSRHESQAHLALGAGAQTVEWFCENQVLSNRFSIGFSMLPAGTIADRVAVLSGQLTLSRLAFWRDEADGFPLLPETALEDPSLLQRLIDHHLTARLAERQMARRALAEGRDARSVGEIAPYDAGLARRLAEAALARKAPAEAVPALQRYTELVPTDPTGFLSSAEALEQSGKTGEALAVLDGAERYRPRDDHVVSARGRLLRSLGRIEEALEIARAQIDFHPLSANAWWLQAQALEQLGDEEGRRAALRRVVELRPGHVQAILALADVAEAEGNPADLVIWLQRACSGGTSDVKLLFRLGRAHALAGEHDAAVRALEAALAINPRLGAARALLDESIAVARKMPPTVAPPLAGVEAQPPARDSARKAPGRGAHWLQRIRRYFGLATHD